jgi:succinyl-diaminopimelate desuccinylase
MERTKQLLRDLLRIDSTPGKEAEIGRFVLGLFEAQGYRVTRQPVPLPAGQTHADGRFNLLLERGEPRLFFFGHLDTVRPVGSEGEHWTHAPLSAAEQEGRMYGLGAADMKGGLAAILGAVLATDPAHIGICLTCDEEGKFLGIHTFLEQDPFAGQLPELAVFAEPTDLRIVHRHRACFEVAFEARGRAAHAGSPQLGCDASKLYACLSSLDEMLQAEYPGTDLNIGYFESGRLDAINVVPDHARAVIDVRPSAALHARGVGYLAEQVIELGSRRGLSVSHQVNIDMKPLDVDPAALEPLCAAVRAAGVEVHLAELDGTSEAGEVHYQLGVPCVHFGPGPQRMSHQVDEFVDLQMLAHTQQVFENLIAAFQR